MVKHNYIYNRQTIRRGIFPSPFFIALFCRSKHLRRRKHKTPNAKAEKSTRRGERDKRGKREQKLSRVNVLNGGAGGKHGLSSGKCKTMRRANNPKKPRAAELYTRTHHECGGWQGANNIFGIGRKNGNAHYGNAAARCLAVKTPRQGKAIVRTGGIKSETHKRVLRQSG